MKKFWIILGCAIYVISPIDLIPDFLIGLGQVDDLAAVIMTLVSVFGSDKKRLPNRSTGSKGHG